MTAPLCFAGGVALQLLARRGVQVYAHIASIGGIADAVPDPCAPDAAALAANWRQLALTDAPRRSVLGQNAFAYYHQHYRRELLLAQLEDFIFGR